MRYFGILVLITFLVLGFMAMSALMAHRVKSQPPREIANQAVANKLARQLDRIITDPTLVGDSQWREQSGRLLDEWYKGR